jgi:thioredoxin-dependent peroxiredoxin
MGRKFMGVERSTFVIDKKGRIAQVFDKVKAAGHAEAVFCSL